MGLNREKDAQEDTRDSNIAMNDKERHLKPLTTVSYKNNREHEQ